MRRTPSRDGILLAGSASIVSVDSGRQPRRNLEQLLQPRPSRVLLRRLDGDGRVTGKRNEHLDLGRAWSAPAARLPDREDAQDPPLRVLERDEQLVIGVASRPDRPGRRRAIRSGCRRRVSSRTPPVGSSLPRRGIRRRSPASRLPRARGRGAAVRLRTCCRRAARLRSPTGRGESPTRRGSGRRSSSSPS